MCVDVNDRVTRPLNTALARMQHAGGLIVGKAESRRIWLFIARRGYFLAGARRYCRNESEAGSVQQLAAIHFSCSPGDSTTKNFSAIASINFLFVRKQCKRKNNENIHLRTVLEQAN